eukprot:TRINITY_DN48052_c0_g1_i1.p1 TRINITY_DN48052_c0_g1~~TRINITY_DN48052_c0_g1_i1.p1  ORF type:complete len:702 (-),score=104.24 TRINITY_DN48052_c0_g1_i1:61-2166(-)
MDATNSKQACVDVLKALERAVRCSQSLPSRDELQLIRVTSSSLKLKGNHLTEQILSEIKSVASRYSVSIASSDSDSSSSHSAGSLTVRDSLFDQTSETTDEALQHFNVALDRVRNICNSVVPPQGALGPKTSAPRVGIGHLGRSHGGFLDIEKPQVHFPDYPIDNSDTPFVAPYVRDQPSGQGTQHTSTQKNSSQNVETYLQELYKKNSNPNCDQRHPYENEISTALQQMSTKEFALNQVTVYKPIQSTPCTFVATEEDLFNVVERLKTASSIAVDLENHSVRSFQGFICLIQISTREEDIVIDALRLRGSIHRALAPIFTDETIIKVLHGADRDVQWLERDFGIYVVNMFDTGQAARLLKLPSASLGFLLSHFCDVSGADKKKFQLADWRQRPLPKNMLHYARSDTHYLLYIFDRLRCDLSRKGLLRKTWEHSAIISKKRHQKVRFQAGIAKHLAARHCLQFDKHQIRLLEELCKWRDTTAREEDESYPYVAPLKVLFGVVRARDKARTVEGLLKHGFPGGIVPPLIYQNAKKLTDLICDALDAKLDNAVHENGGAWEQSEDNHLQMEQDVIDKSVSIDTGKTEEHGDYSVEYSPQSAVAPQPDLPLSSQGMHNSKRKETEKVKNPKSLSDGLKLKVTSTSKSALLDFDSDSSVDEGDDELYCSHIQHETKQNVRLFHAQKRKWTHPNETNTKRRNSPNK